MSVSFATILPVYFYIYAGRHGPLLGRGMGRSVAAGCGVYAWCLGSKQSILGVTPLCVCIAYRLVSEMLHMSIDDDVGGDYKLES